MNATLKTWPAPIALRDAVEDDERTVTTIVSSEAVFAEPYVTELKDQINELLDRVDELTEERDALRRVVQRLALGEST